MPKYLVIGASYDGELRWEVRRASDFARLNYPADCCDEANQLVDALESGELVPEDYSWLRDTRPVLTPLRPVEKYIDPPAGYYC